MPVDLAVILGTRPEAIKLAPVVRAARALGLKTQVISSGQHAELLRDGWRLNEPPDIALNAMSWQLAPEALAFRLARELTPILQSLEPRWTAVQGDTSTALAGAMAARFAGVSCAHVEAGLRSGRLDAPYPEEMFRRVVSGLTHRHFAPTQGARNALLGEGVPEANILVTGQTAVDELVLTADQTPNLPPALRDMPPGTRLVFCTGHRREHFDGRLSRVFAALAEFARSRIDVLVVIALHPNPAVQGELDAVGVLPANMRVLDPLPYDACVAVMRRAAVIVSDSGGIQEEAPSLGVPVLVTRDVTERPEAVDAGFNRLVGTEPDRILHELRALIDDDALRAELRARPNPYGDGHAGERIAADLARLLSA